MRKIIYAPLTSLDGYIEDQNGKIGWTEPTEELHRHFNEREQEVDSHLYGRKVYEIMQYWEDADQNPNNRLHERICQALAEAKEDCILNHYGSGKKWVRTQKFGES